MINCIPCLIQDTLHRSSSRESHIYFSIDESRQRRNDDTTTEKATTAGNDGVYNKVRYNCMHAMLCIINAINVAMQQLCITTAMHAIYLQVLPLNSYGNIYGNNLAKNRKVNSDCGVSTPTSTHLCIS